MFILGSSEARKVFLILRNLEVLLLLNNLLIVVLVLALWPGRLLQIIDCGQSLIVLLLMLELLLAVGTRVPAYAFEPKSSLRDILAVELVVIESKVNGLPWAVLSCLLALSLRPRLLGREVDTPDEGRYELRWIIPRILW